MFKGFRARFKKAEDWIYQQGAKLQSKMITKRVDYETQVPGEYLFNQKSSWIRSYAYDKHTNTLYMTTHKGKTYSWPNIPQDIAVKVRAGLEKCTTNDPTGKGRWFVGKNPSLGAAFWHILKPLAKSMVMSPSPPAALSYFDIPTDAGVIDYDYMPRERGRPTKQEERTRRFGRINPKYKKGATV